MLSVLVLYGLVGSIFSAPYKTVTLHSRIGTITGKQVETSFLEKTGKVNMFLGIPYAEPPVGDRMFKKPVPKAYKHGHLNATDFGPACSQHLVAMMGWVPGFPDVGDDCLTINIFVPAENGTGSGHVDNYSPHAVMVYIYGGAYVIGQSKIYSAENLTLVGDAVVVTFNYRVSALGFLSTGSSKYPGNAGLWDQQLALRWVHENIADFGGDPHRVLVFGESAGGASAILQALYPGNSGYFQRIAASSGSPLCPWAFQPKPQVFAKRLAENFGCTQPDLDAAVDCLQRLSPQTIANSSIIGTPEETAFRAEWDVVYDGDFVQKPQKDLFNMDSSLDTFRNVDLLIGFNNNDGAFISLLSLQPFLTKQQNMTFEDGIPYDFFRNTYVPMFSRDLYGNSSAYMDKWILHEYTDWSNKTDPLLTREKFMELASDFEFFVPALVALRSHATAPVRSKAFLYEFSLKATFNSAPSWIEGAMHGDDLPFVFGFPWTMSEGMKFRNHVPDWEKRYARNMMVMWSNFAKTGDPNLPVPLADNLYWPQYDLDSRMYLQLGREPSVSRDVHGQRANFWLNLEPSLRPTSSGQIIG
ncbi:cholinesterase 1-like [Dreissena polymorpha]|uniref:Carboxylic ester hydrolase n=1 Tax=Dreissena polymorpha TaxID=45954 RepID=A0A9D4FHV7_DREPO|nr:cholinesterase 1-like [Dreissena polymorpha]KAH3796127.1 hypothetical protein DPMN_149694 [Dreissena polymorpha]